MVSAQEWLEENYPKDGNCVRENELVDKDGKVIVNNFGKKRGEITHLQIDQKNLAGTLDISDFINLETLQCWKNQLTKLILPNNDKLKNIGCSENQLTNLVLGQKVNLETLNCRDNQLNQLVLPNSKQLIELNCYNNQLTQLTLPHNNKLKILGCNNNQLTNLDLSSSSQLRQLLCYRNKLTNLILPIPNQLEGISSSNNFLTSFNYFSLNPNSLKELRLWNNDLAETNISVFSQLVNLTNLQIGNDDNWVKTNKANKFFGSLESLKNLNKLKEMLFIANTNINTGLEYLPASLEKFLYYSLAGSNFKVQEIEKQIKSQGGNWESYRKKLGEWKNQGFTVQESQKLMLEWKQIHPDFELSQSWIKYFGQGKDNKEKEKNAYQEAQKWIKAGLTPTEGQFAKWLENKNYVPSEQKKSSWQTVFNLSQKVQLKEQYLTEWGDLHLDFAKKTYFDKTYQQLWQDQKFSKLQAQQYLNQGFTVQDFIFLTFLLKDKRLVIEKINSAIIDLLRTRYNQLWTELDAKFAEKPHGQDGKTYQQYWEEAGISYFEVKEWIKLGKNNESYSYCWPQNWIKQGFAPATARPWLEIGFRLTDSKEAKGWKDHSFTPQNTQSWLANGLGNGNYELVAYLKDNHYTPQNWQNKSQAQHWLDWQYPIEGACIRKDDKENYGKKRNEIIELEIEGWGSPISGSLSLKEFVNLKKFYCFESKISKLDLNDCPKLGVLYCSSGNLTELDLINCKELVELDCSYNEMTNLNNLDLLVNLEELKIMGNEKLNISLDILADLPRLKKFDCHETKLDDELKAYGYPEEKEEYDFNYISLLKSWKKFKDQEQQIQELKNQLIQLQKNDKKQKLLLKKERSQFSQNLIKIKQEKLKLKNSLTKKQEKQQEIKSKLAQLKDDFSNLQGIKKQDEEKINNLNDEFDSLKENIDKIQTESNLLKTEKNELEAEKFKLETDKSNLEKEVVNKNQVVQGLQKENQILDKKISVIEREREQLKNDYENLDKDIKAEKQKVQNLESDKDQLKQNLNQIQQENSEINSQLTAEREKSNLLEINFDEQQNELTKEKQNNQNLQKEIILSNEILRNAKANYEKKQKDINNLHEELITIVVDRALIKREIEVLEKEQQELDELKKKEDIDKKKLQEQQVIITNRLISLRNQLKNKVKEENDIHEEIEALSDDFEELLEELNQMANNIKNKANDPTKAVTKTYRKIITNLEGYIDKILNIIAGEGRSWHLGGNLEVNSNEFINNRSNILNSEAIDRSSGKEFCQKAEKLFALTRRRKRAINRLESEMINKKKGLRSELEETRIKRLRIENQKINSELKEKQSELKELISNHISDSNSKLLEKLQKFQKEIIERGTSDFLQEQVNEIKDELKNLLNSEVIEKICQLQIEIYSLINTKKETIKEEWDKEKIEAELNELSLGGKIGQGGYGVVYSGVYNNDKVAIKKLDIASNSLRELTAIKNELDLLKELTHPNIIKFISSWQESNKLLMIMEYANQGSLTDYINQHKDQEYDWDINYQFIKQMAQGLIYLHSQNIIHRDLKSMNILICEGNIAKISDFGLSKVIGNLTISKITSKGEGISGTIRWMDPYLFKSSGNKYSFQTDIYALGMVIWEIVTKRLPYSHVDSHIIIGQLLADHKEEIPTNTPPVLKTIIRDCWKDDFNQRISLAEIENKLKDPEKSNEIENRINNDKVKGKEKELRELTDSLKEKLKSELKSNSFIYEDRKEKLTDIFNDLPAAFEEFTNTLESLKKGLSKNLTEEIYQLYQVKDELIKLQNQSWKSQIVISPK